VPPATFRNPFERTSQPLHTVAVIPARYHSTRFPGKPLADLTGRPMIEHVYTRAAAAPGVEAVVVATDDTRIEQAVRTFGGIVRMTGIQHRTGLDRIAEVAADLSCEIVVNVQGDEPLIDPQAIAEVIAPLANDSGLQMATLRRRITDPGDVDNPHVVKVVVDRRDRALYFSRATIPFTSEPPEGGPHETGIGPREMGIGPRETELGPHETGLVGAGFSRLVCKHIGIYAYRRTFVRKLAALPQTPLELAESLEQLRALEHGFQICAVETHYDSIGVDTPEDLERVRRQMTVGTQA
jgi:3-deoxy-manno-octulosonate cytidylyltransferase (CMP-KDO synthetase)